MRMQSMIISQPFLSSGMRESDTEKVVLRNPASDNSIYYIQGPTPPQSPHHSAPDLSELDATNGSTLVSVSTSFSPHFRHNDLLPSLVLLSSDSVHFYVHANILTLASENEFNGLLTNSQDPSELVHTTPVPIKPVPLHSATLNILLHAVYNSSCTHFAPSTNTVVEAVDLLPTYGIDPTSCIYSHLSPLSRLQSSRPPQPSPLYSLLLSYAPIHPLDIYTLAAHHYIEDLAIESSQYLLSTPLHSISNHAAIRMGALYLKKLAFLLIGRSEALKKVVAQPPLPHAPTSVCGPTEQKRLATTWTLTVAALVWDAKPDVPVRLIESSLRPLGNHLGCQLCQNNLRDRIRDVTKQWLNVKKTI